MKKIILLLIISSLTHVVTAQKEPEGKEHRPKIRGAIMMANTHVPKATVGGKESTIIPTWAFDVDCYFHSRWSVALQGDVKLQSFEVEDGETVLKRTNPFGVALVLHYHTLRHWSFYMGPGYEIESHGNLFMFIVGTEYSFEITENFEIALNLIYGNKEEVYDAWTFGIAFNKKLWEKK